MPSGRALLVQESAERLTSPGYLAELEVPLLASEMPDDLTLLPALRAEECLSDTRAWSDELRVPALTRVIIGVQGSTVEEVLRIRGAWRVGATIPCE